MIPPTSLMRRIELESSGFNIEEYTNRIRKLSEIADIGYHGHFWTYQGGITHDEIIGMRGRQYNCVDLKFQFEKTAIGLNPRVLIMADDMPVDGISQIGRSSIC